MKRIIKFRAWDGEQMVSPDYIDRQGIAWWKENSIPTSSDKVMQYTGIKDINGIEIFEGDIIKRELSQGDRTANKIILFKDGCFRACKSFGSSHTNKNPIHSKKIFSMNTMIIGNIYQNPELIKS